MIEKDSYKDSGVEWIEKIPYDWNTNRLKWVTEVENSGIWGEDDEFEGSVNVPIPTTGQLSVEGKWNYEKMSLRNLTVEEWEKYQCIKGDVVVVKSSGSSTNIITGKCGFIDEIYSQKFSFSNFLLRVRPTKILDKFVFYFLSSNLTKQRIEKMVSSTTYPNLKVSEYINSIILVPPSTEQSFIVSYLDKKTQQIDELVGKVEKNIELLKEHRNSLINEVVTKGLNPNVEMKDSGVEWIGEIPVHWNVKRLRFLGSFSNGLSKGSEYFGKGFPFFTYGDIYNNHSLPTEPGGLVESDESDRNKCSVKRGDIFFTRTSESTDDIGISSTCLKTIPDSTFSGFIIRFRPHDETLKPEFSKYFFQNHYKKTFIESRMNIVTRSSLSQTILGSVSVLYPLDHKEQQEIVDYLDQKTTVIDGSISKEEKRIELLKEYKKSLISEVVTGKTRVTEDMV